MKFALKSVQHSERQSQETHSFSAFLYIDGVKSFEVSNDGWGGPNMTRQLGKLTEAEVNTWLAANRPNFGQEYGMSIEHDMDIEVGDLMNRYLAGKELDKMLKKGLVAIGKDDAGKPALYEYGKIGSNKLTSASATPGTVVSWNAELDKQGRGHKVVTKYENYDEALEALGA